MTSVQNPPFDPSKIIAPKCKADVYGIHGKNLTQENLRAKLSLPGRANLPPVLPMSFARSKHVDSSIPQKVGILGAGVGGLYAGMILQSLNIPFEILEASNRTGGRVFTYQFSEKEHDYYDVGAMRFPDERAMCRLFHLFKSHQLNSDDRSVEKKLIPYIFKSKNSFRLYNGRRLRAYEVADNEDQFDFAATGVPQLDLTDGYEAILKSTFGPFADGLRQDLVPPGSTSGWQRMMRQDNHSARSYMAIACNYPMPTVHWCETMDASTDAYDKGFSDTVLDVVAFGDDETKWWCLDGGSRVLPDAMENFINKYSPGSLIKNKVVTGLQTSGDGGVVAIDVLLGQETRTYQHVLSTIPLPVFRTLDLDDPRLFEVEQTNALRELSYGPSIKVGIKFQTQWWAENGLNIVGGQSYTDRNVRTTVYPSYGIPQEKDGKLVDPPNNVLTNVLIASYMWTADSTAMGALVKRDDPVVMERLKEVVLRDLAQLHGVDLEFLKKQFVEMFPWAWQNDPLTQGAFAFFGPGQFGRLYRSLTRPCGGDHLHMAGEALSPRHAWIVGALDSSWRAVEEILIKSYPEKLSEFFRLWGNNEEWIPHPDWLHRLRLSKETDSGHPVDLVMLNMAAHNAEFMKSLG